ncbi:MAG: preprotein translocase subunit SecY [Candidatus Woesearchaeota archaeon]
MGILNKFLAVFPEVKKPTEKRLPFKTKLKWTLIILTAFFVLGVIPLYGLGENSLIQFEQLSIILGASFGSIVSLGIGPIVTASIVLQLLSGSGLLKIDTTTPKGRQLFQGLQKVLIIFFIIFEALIYVLMGGLAPSANLPLGTFRLAQMLLVVQLFFGGLLIMFMDDVINKWGFGSGVSLFIAAGVSQQIFIRAFSPLTSAGTLALGSGQAAVGQVWVLFASLIGRNPIGASLALAAILATIIVFLFSVYAQAMKVEIPLSFGRIRGHGIRWPLRFLYTSNIPVILIAALLANVQLLARLLQNAGIAWLGTFSGNQPVSGLISWIYPTRIVQNIITGSFRGIDLAHSGVYMLLMMGGAVLFSYFWVQTSGMDAKAQAKQIMSSGLQIPGFRRDERVLEQILKRYITPLTIMGGLAIGFLAAAADLLGALTSGTGLLLTVMIIYRLYEEIAQQHMMDMYPALRKVMEK